MKTNSCAFLLNKMVEGSRCDCEGYSRTLWRACHKPISNIYLDLSAHFCDSGPESELVKKSAPFAGASYQHCLSDSTFDGLCNMCANCNTCKSFGVPKQETLGELMLPQSPEQGGVWPTTPVPNFKLDSVEPTAKRSHTIEPSPVQQL